MLQCPTEQAHNSAKEGDERPVWEVTVSMISMLGDRSSGEPLRDALAEL
jgi:hypothetical protein